MISSWHYFRSIKRLKLVSSPWILFGFFINYLICLYSTYIRRKMMQTLQFCIMYVLSWRLQFFLRLLILIFASRYPFVTWMMIFRVWSRLCEVMISSHRRKCSRLMMSQWSKSMLIAFDDVSLSSIWTCWWFSFRVRTWSLRMCMLSLSR